MKPYLLLAFALAIAIGLTVATVETADTLCRSGIVKFC
jgi:hypothetical protein